MKLINSILILLLVAGTIATTSCRHDKNVVPSVDSGKVYFHLHTNLGDSEVDGYGSVYALNSGRKISLTKAQLYISNIEMVADNGSVYSIPNAMVLKSLEVEEYFVANVPSGSYKSVNFHVGLNPTGNAQTPSSSATDVLNHADMWFGSAAQPDGYIFVNAQGTVDTTTAGNGTVAQMQPFLYQIGTNSHYQTVSMPVHTPSYTVVSSTDAYVHITIDYSQLLNGVQLNNAANLKVKTAADNTSAVSNLIFANIPSMFHYEE